MISTAEFARIRIDATGPAVWLRTAGGLLCYLTKPAEFRFVSLTNDAAEAIVLTPHHAAWVVDLLQPGYPHARLEPATFAEWVDSPVGPAFSIPTPLDECRQARE